MNPYASKTTLPKKPFAAAGASLFAAGVYEEEDERPRTPPPPRNYAAPLPLPGTGEISRLRNELRGETRMLRTAMQQPTRLPAELSAELATLRAAVDELLAKPAKKGDAVTAALRTAGIEGGAAAALARLTKGKRGGVNGKLRAAAQSFLRTSAWAPAMVKDGRTIIALVGPAGVGKTTTAAKLAARSIMAKKSVALISCDAYRVGAMDQLGEYADLMEARFHTAMNQQELLDILACETADVIIVDTSGRAIEPEATEAALGAIELRGPRGENERAKPRVEVLLCVSASLRAADAGRIHRDFAIAQPTALTITKIDETDAPAGIIHAAFVTGLPISTACSGQRVPEDISQANTASLAQNLFPQNDKEEIAK